MLQDAKEREVALLGPGLASNGHVEDHVNGKQEMATGYEIVRRAYTCAVNLSSNKVIGLCIIVNWCGEPPLRCSGLPTAVISSEFALLGLYRQINNFLELLAELHLVSPLNFLFSSLFRNRLWSKCPELYEFMSFPPACQ